MSANADTLASTVRAAIASQAQPTRDQIKELIDQFRQLPMMRVDDDVAEQVCRDIEASLDISMDIGAVLKEEFAEWLSGAKQNITPYYWDRYRQLLESKGFPRKVLARLDEVTDRILGLLQNPVLEGHWDRRGMVVGHVQSGKTANYTGLICKAADAGYKLIIVIAGIHNNLRNQTQARIDEGFVGIDSSSADTGHRRPIGVGRFDVRQCPLTLTTAARDFNSQVAGQVGLRLRDFNGPTVLVIKKNAHTLKNLIHWLRAYNARGDSNLVDLPMLLIDDEADNASIDISRDPERSSTINRRIRKLLAMFNRRSYIGYTATPFANIFIDPDTDDDMCSSDLFPRDFIISLDPPSNYFGATQIFSEEDGNPVLSTITDNEDRLPLKHKNFHEIAELPESMLAATRTFIVARAIRILRGQGSEHSSMLVNASRFTSVQGEIRDHLHDYVDQIKRHIRYNRNKSAESACRNDGFIKDLYDAWESEYSNLEFDWGDIYPTLLEAIAPVSVISVNSQSSTPLDYQGYKEGGRQVIAVGGFSLSRGLTLEGLVVSYFLRNSMMYDTLMQMGRWFGYRPGYEDLCRIWMTEEAIGWYSHIADSIEELRSELRQMEQANLTPKQFGLKVRAHPDSLIVTARNKMGSADRVAVRIGLSNRFIETVAIPKSPTFLEQNLGAARTLVQKVHPGYQVDDDGSSGNILYTGVSSDHVMDFLRSWRNAKGSIITEPDPVVEFISKHSSSSMASWDVALIGVSQSRASKSQALGPAIRCQKRTVGYTKDESVFISLKHRVASRGDEKIGLTDEELQLAASAWQKKRAELGKTTNNVPDYIYRAVRSRPLLMIHLLELEPRINDDGTTYSAPDSPVVAWGISFPAFDDADDETVEYIVNATWLQKAFGDDFDEEEADTNGQ